MPFHVAATSAISYGITIQLHVATGACGDALHLIHTLRLSFCPSMAPVDLFRPRNHTRSKFAIIPYYAILCLYSEYPSQNISRVTHTQFVKEGCVSNFPQPRLNIESPFSTQSES